MDKPSHGVGEGRGLVSFVFAMLPLLIANWILTGQPVLVTLGIVLYLLFPTIVEAVGYHNWSIRSIKTFILWLPRLLYVEFIMSPSIRTAQPMDDYLAAFPAPNRSFNRSYRRHWKTDPFTMRDVLWWSSILLVYAALIALAIKVG